MGTLDIRTDDYEVRYDETTHTVTCVGSFRLGGVEEYAPITQILNQVAAQGPETLTLDLSGLRFLNSSGINVLSKFVIGIRQKGTIGLVVLGSKEIPWQGKSLVNLKRLMPALTLKLE
jgi:hypothetical protein